jgi:hypothetical protein
MKYKIDTKELITDKGIVLKKMQCSIEVDWEEMQPGKNDLERICSHCNKTVLNIDSLSDEEVIFVLSKKPDTCIKINAKKY